MVDLTPLEKYVVDNANQYVREADKTINKIGFKNWFNEQLSCFLDCSKRLNNGQRCIQSNFIHYKYEITTIIYMIDKYGGDNNDYYYELLLLQHKANLEFESVNGLEFDVKEATKKKRTTTRNKQTSLIDKPKQETAAERKLKAHIAKISSLNIKIKPVRNDNTV